MPSIDGRAGIIPAPFTDAMSMRLRFLFLLACLWLLPAVAMAADCAPADTRAWFRGECVRRFGGQVAAASWDSVIFDVPGRNALVRVPTSDPMRGTREHVGELLASVEGVGQLVAALGGPAAPATAR